MRLNTLREEVLEKSLQMLQDGLVFGSSGNISARDPETGLIAITPSAVEYSKMKPDDIVVIDKDGQLQDGKWRPTSESPMHCIFYRQREDVGAVVHTHAPHASVFAIIYEAIPLVVTESALCLGAPVRVAPYAQPGTEALAQVVFDSIEEDVAILLGQHGLLTIGRTLSEAYASTIAAETSAHLTIMARTMGVEPTNIDLAEVAHLRKLYLKHYRPSKD